ncbi:MAG: NADH-quinone oxidoreductase subunit M [Acidobacteriota bacterium]|nr:NADH-quinone oxidoreductase subunit M [Blastocatellia bacterium]MDW8238383.1 NADH-quinone oxidoreductase subunit M [Acidobacteriota bacterium]
MDVLLDHPLTLVVFLPTVGAALLLLYSLWSGKDDDVVRFIAFVFSLLTFIMSLPLVVGFNPRLSGMQFTERVPWINSFGLNVEYHLGLDGLSLWLVVLTTVLTVVSVLASWQSIQRHVSEFFIFLLLLETGILGVFVALDMFLFYLFWEVMLVPMYFLIGVWGGEQRIYAAIKFIIYTMAGSVLMLVAMLALYYLNGQATGQYTFDLVQITKNLQQGVLTLDPQVQMWLFLGFAIAFMIKVPLFPLHTWLPDAHVEAPTAGSIMLAGVLLKMGTYGLLRFNLPMFPQATAEWTTPICILAVIGIIYGALVAMVQPDMKKLVAYSSVSHMGFVVLGTFAQTEQALHGAIFQMLSHGVATGALFLLVGIIYDRRHTRLIADFGGIANVMPVYTGMFGIIMLASVGLPMLSGFVGEFLVLVGTYTSKIAYARWFTVLAALGVILSAVYLLWLFQRVFMGEITNPENAALADVNAREKMAMMPLVVLVIVLGVVPNWFLRKMDPAVRAVMPAAVTAVESGHAQWTVGGE